MSFYKNCCRKLSWLHVTRVARCSNQKISSDNVIRLVLTIFLGIDYEIVLKKKYLHINFFNIFNIRSLDSFYYQEILLSFKKNEKVSRGRENIINTDFINFYNFDNWLKIEKLILT